MGANDSTAPMVEAPAGPVAPQPGEVQDQSADQSAESAKSPASAADADSADRSVITTGWASITVDDPIAAAEDAATIAKDAGGRVDNRSESPGTDAQPPSASLTLRVPSDQVDDVVDELRTLGTVNSVSMNASDVTQQRQDLDARIEALTVSVDRLTQLLATATTVTDLIAIESELTTRQAELDSLTQQRDSLVDQIDYATIGLELVTAAAAPDPQPDDFWSGIVVGWNALVGFAAWLGVAIGVALPWLLAALVTGAVVILIVVLTTPRRRPADDAAAAPRHDSPEA